MDIGRWAQRQAAPDPARSIGGCGWAARSPKALVRSTTPAVSTRATQAAGELSQWFKAAVRQRQVRIGSMVADQPPAELSEEQKERLVNLRARREAAVRNEDEAEYAAAEKATLELFDGVLRDRRGR